VHPEVDEVLTLDGAIAALHFHHFGGKLKKTRENFKKRGKIKKNETTVITFVRRDEWQRCEALLYRNISPETCFVLCVTDWPKISEHLKTFISKGSFIANLLQKNFVWRNVFVKC
jgi:hypothetical protein